VPCGRRTRQRIKTVALRLKRLHLLLHGRHVGHGQCRTGQGRTRGDREQDDECATT
jgi:hypothetical protein